MEIITQNRHKPYYLHFVLLYDWSKYFPCVNIYLNINGVNQNIESVNILYFTDNLSEMGWNKVRTTFTTTFLTET